IARTAIAAGRDAENRLASFRSNHYSRNCTLDEQMSPFVKLLATVGTALCLVGGLHATGYFGPYIYLDDGGKNVAGSPEFYWALEVRRISGDFSSSREIGRIK